MRRFFILSLILLAACSSSSSSSDDGTDDDLDLNDRSYSCTQEASTGDTCGDDFITGTATTFTFSQSASLAGVDIGGQISLSGTFEDNSLSLLNDETEYIGPGCHVTFTNVTLTATINTSEEVEGTWTGVLSYGAEVDGTDSDCDDYSVSLCTAVHSVSCTAN